MQQNITQHLINEIAKEIDVHYACLSVQDLMGTGHEEYRIILWTSGMHKYKIGYWTLRFRGDVPSIGSWYEERSYLRAADSACETIKSALNNL
jgi:hypothetical protein